MIHKITTQNLHLPQTLTITHAFERNSESVAQKLNLFLKQPLNKALNIMGWTRYGVQWEVLQVFDTSFKALPSRDRYPIKEPVISLGHQGI